MREDSLLSLLEAPHVTEKGSQVADLIVFKVKKQATKQQIKDAVELALDAKVVQVRVCNIKQKAARFGRIMGQHAGWKKAYITLAPGTKLKFAAEGQ